MTDTKDLEEVNHLGYCEQSGSTAVSGLKEEKSGSGSEVNKRPKYFDILDAMVRFNRTVFIVEKLCDDIVGVGRPNAPTPDEEPETEPCLLEVLERTPGNIHAGCNLIEETVKEIRAQIL